MNLPMPEGFLAWSDTLDHSVFYTKVIDNKHLELLSDEPWSQDDFWFEVDEEWRSQGHTICGDCHSFCYYVGLQFWTDHKGSDCSDGLMFCNNCGEEIA